MKVFLDANILFSGSVSGKTQGKFQELVVQFQAAKSLN